MSSGNDPIRLRAMSRRIDIELTSVRPDGTWTWRAAGAQKPKGVLEGSILPEGAKNGDVLKVEAEFEIEGISILSVVGGAALRKEPTLIELIPQDRSFEPVTQTLAKRDRSDRPRRDDRPRREGDTRDRGPRPEGARGPRPDGGRGPRPDAGRGTRPRRPRRRAARSSPGASVASEVRTRSRVAAAAPGEAAQARQGASGRSTGRSARRAASDRREGPERRHPCGSPSGERAERVAAGRGQRGDPGRRAAQDGRGTPAPLARRGMARSGGCREGRSRRPRPAGSPVGGGGRRRPDGCPRRSDARPVGRAESSAGEQAGKGIPGVARGHPARPRRRPGDPSAQVVGRAAEGRDEVPGRHFGPTGRRRDCGADHRCDRRSLVGGPGGRCLLTGSSRGGAGCRSDPGHRRASCHGHPVGGAPPPDRGAVRDHRSPGDLDPEALAADPQAREEGRRPGRPLRRSPGRPPRPEAGADPTAGRGGRPARHRAPGGRRTPGVRRGADRCASGRRVGAGCRTADRRRARSCRRLGADYRAGDRRARTRRRPRARTRRRPRAPSRRRARAPPPCGEHGTRTRSALRSRT